MKIIVNAVSYEVTATVLSDVLDELGFTSSAMATAVNGRFVPRDARAMSALNDGDQLEVLAPMQGG